MVQSASRIGPKAGRFLITGSVHGRLDAPDLLGYVELALAGGYPEPVLRLHARRRQAPEWLREQLGERFLAGAVLHTGPRPFRLAERVFALPICALWG